MSADVLSLAPTLCEESLALLEQVKPVLDQGPYAVGHSHRYYQELYRVGERVIEVLRSKRARDGLPANTVLHLQDVTRPAGDGRIAEVVVQKLLAGTLAEESPMWVAAQLEGSPFAIAMQGWYFVETVHTVLDWQIKICYPIVGRNKSEAFRVSVQKREFFAGHECFAISEFTPEIGYADPIFYEGGLCINWGAPRIGFGQLYLSRRADGRLVCDAEHMDQAFVRAVLARLADEIHVLDDEEIKQYVPPPVDDLAEDDSSDEDTHA